MRHCDQGNTACTALTAILIGRVGLGDVQIGDIVEHCMRIGSAIQTLKKLDAFCLLAICIHRAPCDLKRKEDQRKNEQQFFHCSRIIVVMDSGRNLKAKYLFTTPLKDKHRNG